MPDDIPHSHTDFDRERRCGFSEVVYCPGKSDQQLVDIMKGLIENHDNVIASRITPEQFTAIKSLHHNLIHNPTARMAYLHRNKSIKGIGTVLVISAGTSDTPIAEEAALTAEIMGNDVRRIYDVGVAGLHRLMNYTDTLQQANVIIAVAGMEGALPSIVAGLIDRPIIAVPTSVGYGTSFNGLAALLGMLNACASGVTVVNIDNGFGAAYAATRINRRNKSFMGSEEIKGKRA
ncbi:MAG: 1-(5-phosphoribosyl)-5-amino-4-imidazole-carboxylate carboxylase [candidate division Zixibacteria bacterium CG_4_9_14_3_um_filter_46_8]|nr:MAG: 1-(5-phosphoribosyl)-5-amino-4-imidazole-carboxylate carboxylase [candidate division Zixibacteria bacterium CG_4_9_14_3_um_filter_46_8]